MKAAMRTIFQLVLIVAVVSTGPVLLKAQAGGQPGSPEAATKPAPDSRFELGLEYSYLRSNAPPGGCTCFNLNGGSANIAWTVKPKRFALAADFTIANAAHISPAGYNITLSTYTVGGRYLLPVRHSRLTPFAQALVGVGHASGSLVESPNPAAANAGAAFAAHVGGGLDLRVNRHFAIRLVDANYLVTTFQNGSNNHQNNVRISAGFVVRF